MTKNSPGPRVRRFSTDERNYRDPAYKKWRAEVRKRDSNTCQWPGCGCTQRLRVHHIRTWAEHPSLRFVVANGITLCREHHDAIWGKEEDYERLFATIVAQIQKDPKFAKRDRKPRRKSAKKNARRNARKSFAAEYVKAKRKARRQK